MNELRRKLESGQILIGTQAFLGSKEIMEIFGALGYDFVFICGEHPAYGYERIYDMVKYCESAGTPALVRLPEFDLTFTKKVLDMGVSGVLFPMIKGYSDAKAATDTCLYPPYGKRGFGPMSAVKWGIKSESEFVQGNRQGTVRMIQIEHINAVRELDQIVKIDGIDAFIFGPNDLAASMGHINDMYHEEVQKEMIAATKILQKAGKRFGVSLGSIDGEKLAYWKSIGMTIFSVGADFAFLRDSASNAQKQLFSLLK